MASINDWASKAANQIAVECGALAAEDRIAAIIRQHSPLLLLLQYLYRGHCWCEVSIGNPMVQTHTPGCVFASQLMEELRRG